MLTKLLHKEIFIIVAICLGMSSCLAKRDSELKLINTTVTKKPWLVKVTTTYNKGVSSKTFTGKGYIVRNLGRNFVVTNAHLTGGVETNIFIRDLNSNWIPTKIIGQRSDSLLDLSVLEVSSELSPLAELVVKRTLGPTLLEKNAKILEVIAPGFQNAHTDAVRLIHSNISDYHSLSLGTFIPADEKTQLLKSESYDTHLSNYKNLIFGEKLDYQIDPQYERFFYTRLYPYSRNIGFNRYYIGSNIVAGHSGSPVIAIDMVNQRWIVTGTVASYHRMFTESYYTSPETGLFSMIEDFDTYKEPSLGWELESGELIRTGKLLKNQLEFRESSVTSTKPSGDGISGDGGDGISGDGGDGISGDGGDGIGGDGGDGKPSNQKLYAPGVFLRESNSHDEFKNVVAFPLLVRGRYEVIYANMAALEFFEDFSKALPGIDLVKQSSDPNDKFILTNSVLQWYGNFQPSLDDYKQTLDIPFIMSQSQPWISDSHLRTNVRLQVQFQKEDNSNKVFADLARFIISTKEFGNITLVFNRYGGLVTAGNSLARFKPIIEVQSENGEWVKLDLTNFLFKNLAVFDARFIYKKAESDQYQVQIWPKLRILDREQRKFEVGAPYIANKRFPEFTGPLQ